jgi:hypothetical protein
MKTFWIGLMTIGVAQGAFAQDRWERREEWRPGGPQDRHQPPRGPEFRWSYGIPQWHQQEFRIEKQQTWNRCPFCQRPMDQSFRMQGPGPGGRFESDRFYKRLPIERSRIELKRVPPPEHGRREEERFEFRKMPPQGPGRHEEERFEFRRQGPPPPDRPDFRKPGPEEKPQGGNELERLSRILDSLERRLSSLEKRLGEAERRK